MHVNTYVVIAVLTYILVVVVVVIDSYNLELFFFKESELLTNSINTAALNLNKYYIFVAFR